MVECCKYAYDNTQEKHSLNHGLDDMDSLYDSKRMVRQRTLSYIKEHRSVQQRDLKIRGLSIDGLSMPDLLDIKSKIAGYSLNEFQLWEVDNVNEMRLVKAIVERRIMKKNFDTNTFKEYAAEYDDFFTKLEADWYGSTGNVLFDFLALYTLEWKYSFDFYYELVEEMSKCNVDEIPDMRRRLAAFSGTPTVNSILLQEYPMIVGGIITMDSRMLVQRRKYIHDIVTVPVEKFEKELNQYVESLVIVASMLTRMTLKSINIREWFVKNTTPEDWKSVFRDYDVFQVFVPNKDWVDKKKIRYIKNIYGKMSFDYKNPKNRS